MLSLPTMLIRGSQTDRVHSHVTELLAKTIPQARLKVVDGAGHMLTLTHPIVVSGLIESHVGDAHPPRVEVELPATPP